MGIESVFERLILLFWATWHELCFSIGHALDAHSISANGL
ncbi:hypothetical protein Thpro_021655 [Acidihalobacter prosperus]|uniref:Uncharacterized protein n=1 Tax=Acidihalobacter prosperus TaxID=160660 RepID=A0A1A6C434_9GAMM|nr:hypothetical protein Thpro_021655 [Acidihalobacter prosperus]